MSDEQQSIATLGPFMEELETEVDTCSLFFCSKADIYNEICGLEDRMETLAMSGNTDSYALKELQERKDALMAQLDVRGDEAAFRKERKKALLKGFVAYMANEAANRTITLLQCRPETTWSVVLDISKRFLQSPEGHTCIEENFQLLQHACGIVMHDRSATSVERLASMTRKKLDTMAQRISLT